MPTPFFFLSSFHARIRHAESVQLARSEVEKAVKMALAEDVGPGDVTTLAVCPRAARARALMVAREPLIMAGAALVPETFRQLSRSVVVRGLVEDGRRARRGETLFEIAGPSRPILTGERVALNFLQRLCGIATVTARFVQAIKGTRAVILDTRKTTPGLRALEKYAVSCGGGQNHRQGLHDMILIKDNHLAVLRGETDRPIALAIQRARRAYPRLELEVEVENPDEAGEAADAGADRILLDNMNTAKVRAAVRRIAGRARTEASGGITLPRAGEMGRAGVDFISVGALTHSAVAVDIGLDFLTD